MDNLEKLGFDNWLNDKVDLSRTNDLKITRVISVKKTRFKWFTSLIQLDDK